MNGAASEERQKTVRVIPPKVDPILAKLRDEAKQLRTVAYCRVSTKQEEQLNSYDTQVKYYTEKINAEPKWKFAGIYADKGISGTSVKKRDEFNRMIRACKRGSVDLILTKSISRFARNTVDCLKYVRLLRELNVDVYFEEQGIHSNQPGAEFYITIYGSLAQSESENISANVRWGKEQSAKQGKVIFQYQSLLGYRRGADGQPEIDEKEAETVRLIYRRYLMGDSLRGIADRLEHQGILSPKGKSTWDISTIRSILSNEKYKGDAILNKTYTVDCISKKVRQNNGERPMYYVEHNHPAIIDPDTFGRVQEELARRAGKPKTKQVGTKTEMGKYSSKYALTDLLVCGECGTPYTTHTCSRCGTGFNDTFVPPLGHDYEEIEVAPTCTEEGYRGKKCRRCEDTIKTEILKAVGHKFTDSYFIATCEEEGYTLHTCLSCGNEYKDNIVPATGHDYETEVVREPHCETEGERKFHCTKCEKEYYSEIPAIGHNYELTGTEEVNGENIRTYICTNCGAITTQNMGEQYEQVSSYIEYLFEQYQPYMWWVLLATAGVWSIVMGVFFAIAQKNEEKEKARKMIKNYIIGLVVIFAILVACPYLVKGIAALIAG